MKIKGFDKDLKCRGYQFEVGKEYKIETDKPLELCTNTVFHYCDSLQKVHEHYSCSNAENRFCEIEVLGEEVSDGSKCGSNHIRIVREITGDELSNLKGLINGNTGLFNTGNGNTGDGNTGYGNTGYRNTGYRNTGYRNTGNGNTGDWNTGYYNTGDGNTGVFNSCNNSNSVFCNKEDKNIRIFNMPSGMSLTEFYNSKYYDAILSSSFILTEWIEYTEEEKKADKEKELIGGYLKSYSYKDACAKWWDNMTDENKDIIKSMPNFNAEIFEDITGIKVD